MDDLHDQIESTLIKFADNTKVGCEIDKAERRTILQRDLNRLEEWTSKNFVKFNTHRCKTLH